MSIKIIHAEQDIGESITTQALDIGLIEKVDEYGELCREIKDAEKQLAPLKKKMLKLKGELIEEGDSFERDEVVELVGEDYLVELSKNSKQVVAIDKAALKAALGDETFYELADVGVGDIRKYCTPPQLEKILAEELSGTRRVSVEKK